MSLDLTGDRPIKIRMAVAIMLIGIVASSAASYAVTFWSLRRDVSDLTDVAHKLAGAAEVEARARQEEDTKIRDWVSSFRREDGVGEAAFRSAIDTRLRAVEDINRDQNNDIKRIQQDNSTIFAKIDAVNGTLEEVRRVLAALLVKVENISAASEQRLPGDPPRRRP